MLSLVGSLQEDPFSPKHVSAAATTVEAVLSDAEDVIEEEPERMMVDADSEEEDEVKDSGSEDTFGKLGRGADEAASKSKQKEKEKMKRKLQEEEEQSKKRKKK